MQKAVVSESGKSTWVPARAGCYWSWQDFSISTFERFGATGLVASGYMLRRNREEIGECDTLAQAQFAAEKIVELEEMRRQHAVAAQYFFGGHHA